MQSERILCLRTIETDQEVPGIPIICGRMFPSGICFSLVNRKNFGREEFTRGCRRKSTSLFRKHVCLLIAKYSNKYVVTASEELDAWSIYYSLANLLL
ncbi:hypothetical protein AVEN_95796-1 [Araneus ventricosus]|uniref:Uncharacterized protein n=1 Tax=Araneus ventricosus TaxID=182803 RepID=A0A4Y2U9L8_ARAVE|nr:hypothetical protein AVEN_95796-1 [Araneus ventricosus]